MVLQSQCLFTKSCNLGVVNQISGRFCLLFSGIAPPVGLQGLEISPFRATGSCIVLGVLVIRETHLIQVLVNGVKCVIAQNGKPLILRTEAYLKRAWTPSKSLDQTLCRRQHTFVSKGECGRLMP